MLLSFLPFLLSVCWLVRDAVALPAGPPATNSPNRYIYLPSGNDTSLSPSNVAPLVYPPSNGNPAMTQPVGAPRRPGDNHIWPEVPAAHYYIKFNHYGDDFGDAEGRALLYKASHDVEGWIKSSKKGSYTPVDEEHHWTEGRSFLTIEPSHDGYLLGDLDKYLAQILAFHVRYGGFWAWEAQLMKKGFMGILVGTGKARLQTR
ncbi:MAG: hypothetical protein Q9219_006905 [cf. Caloplaca sp. 3 TL-2023]